jgi:hypothetical protein
VTLLVPIPDNAPKPDVGKAPALAAWHERMATPEAKQAHRARASLCELPTRTSSRSRSSCAACPR